MSNGETAITEKVASLSKVDSCLAELYTRAIVREGAVPTAKAVMLNLVIYAADAGLADSASEHASRVLSSISCRTIIVDMSSGAQAEGASVSLICGISERGDKRLCGEVIRLYAASGSVTGAVMPLLIPDVPVYLWVHGEVPPEREDFADLLRVASHLIVDSRTGSETARNLRAIDRLSKAEVTITPGIIPGGMRIVQDLGWISIQTWREATAQHFDAPAVRHCLAQIKEVNIRYSGAKDRSLPESPPLLFASWLMERTQTAPTEVFHSKDEGYRITARQDDNPVVLRLAPEDSELEIGRLLSVQIRCGEGETAAVFTTDAASATQLSLTEDCTDVCLPSKLIDVPDPNDAALATIALSSYRRDHVFARALEVALLIMSQAELADERSARFRL
jgi:glucose-6-phosphate dehydrogenase assembly protein OpcA